MRRIDVEMVLRLVAENAKTAVRAVLRVRPEPAGPESQEGGRGSGRRVPILSRVMELALKGQKARELSRTKQQIQAGLHRLTLKLAGLGALVTTQRPWTTCNMIWPNRSSMLLWSFLSFSLPGTGRTRCKTQRDLLLVRLSPLRTRHRVGKKWSHQME